MLYRRKQLLYTRKQLLYVNEKEETAFVLWWLASMARQWHWVLWQLSVSDLFSYLQVWVTKTLIATAVCDNWTFFLVQEQGLEAEFWESGRGLCLFIPQSTPLMACMHCYSFKECKEGDDRQPWDVWLWRGHCLSRSSHHVLTLRSTVS